MLPKQLSDVISNLTNTEINKVTPVSGGDINQAARLTLSDGREILLKWRPGSAQGMFTVERRGLELMRATNTLRIPAVVAQQEAQDGCPAFIALEWLGRGGRVSGVAKALGQGLAEMHRHTNDQYGLDHDNFIGANPQPNQLTADWVTFFREQRLGFQMQLADRNGYLNQRRHQLLDRLFNRLGELLPTNPPASLLHGDLWGGNWLVTADGEPALIDPAVYYGDREAELAFTELFGGFPANFYAAYNQTWPLEPGYQERRDLYNLYHLLNHLNLFGEGYGGRVDSILRRYA